MTRKPDICEQTTKFREACLTCPMFLTTAEFLPQHHSHRQQVLRIISAAEARGQVRLVEMKEQVLGNLDRIITTLQDDPQPGEEITDASLTTPITSSPRHVNAPRAPTAAPSPHYAEWTPPACRSPSTPSPAKPASPDRGSTPNPTCGPR